MRIIGQDNNKNQLTHKKEIMKQLLLFILTLISMVIFSYSLVEGEYFLAGYGFTLSAGGVFCMYMVSIDKRNNSNN